MNRKEFTKILNNRLKVCKGVLSRKGGVYATGMDRLSNFKSAGMLLNCTPERALQGMMTKHIVALNDFIARLDTNEVTPLAEWEEKIGDIINYLILLEAVVRERSNFPAVLPTNKSKINPSCGPDGAAGPAHTQPKSQCSKKTDTNQKVIAPLATNQTTGTPELPGMSQEVLPGLEEIAAPLTMDIETVTIDAKTFTLPTTDGKHWKEAIEVPAEGMKVRIAAIDVGDVYWERRDEFVGQQCTALQLTKDADYTDSGWFYGSVIYKKATVTFARVKLEIQV